MGLSHVPGLLRSPQQEWAAIRDRRYTTSQIYLGFVLPLALVPVLAGFIGTTQVGWQIGTGAPVRLTLGSATQMAIAYYAAICVAVYTVGRLIHWMGETYEARVDVDRGVALAAYTVTPLLLIGIAQLYPVLWLNFILGLPALGYTVFLLYTGVPVMMEIPPERGFLFASAVLAVGLVFLVGMLAATALLWGFGIGPTFTH